MILRYLHHPTISFTLIHQMVDHHPVISLSPFAPVYFLHHPVLSSIPSCINLSVLSSTLSSDHSYDLHQLLRSFSFHHPVLSFSPSYPTLHFPVLSSTSCPTLFTILPYPFHLPIQHPVLYPHHPVLFFTIWVRRDVLESELGFLRHILFVCVLWMQ